MQIHYKDLVLEIEVFDNPLARDWHEVVRRDLDINRLQRDYVNIGFPGTEQDLVDLCENLNTVIQDLNVRGNQEWISNGLDPYVIEEHFSPDTVRFDPQTYKTEIRKNLDFHAALGMRIKHSIMNQLHLHFEFLQGTVEDPSKYFLCASDEIKNSIGKLNTMCHSLESLILSQRKAVVDPEWIRPSQIFSFHPVKRYELTDEHCQLFAENLFDRRLGYLYLHYSQIGKTWFEMWRDEGAPELDEKTCSALSNPLYYSCEFDIEWGRDITREHDFHLKDIADFRLWVEKEFKEWNPIKQRLGHIPLGRVIGLSLLPNQDLYGPEIWDTQEINSKSWQCLQTAGSVVSIIP